MSWFRIPSGPTPRGCRSTRFGPPGFFKRVPSTPGECHAPARRGHPSPCGIRYSRTVRPINRSPKDRPGGLMTLVAQRCDNPWHGQAAGAAIQRTLEDGCLGAPSGVRRAVRRHRGPHRDVVGLHAEGPGRRGDYLALRRRRRDVGGVSSGPGTSFPSHDLGTGRCGSCSSRPRSTLVRQRSGPDGPAVAVASAVRQSSVLST